MNTRASDVWCVQLKERHAAMRECKTKVAQNQRTVSRLRKAQSVEGAYSLMAIDKVRGGYRESVQKRKSELERRWRSWAVRDFIAWICALDLDCGFKVYREG